MSKARTKRSVGKQSPLLVRLDNDSKATLTQAATLRAMNINDYVRMVTVTQARREVTAAEQGTLVMMPDEQLALWTSLIKPFKLTAAQKKLGALMRGEALAAMMQD